MLNELHSELIKLLEHYTDDSIAAELLGRMSKHALIKADSFVMDCISAFRIYSTRAEINAEESRSTKGFETLIPALKNADVSHVRVYALDFPDRLYMAFTDEPVNQLFGILEKKPEK